MRAIRPLIIVQTNPQAINKGQPLTISARLYNRYTNQPLPVRKIFLNIISQKDGHTVWPMEVVRKNDWKFDILIGTTDMKEGHSYLIRVSNNRNLSPMGATTFQIVKDTQIPIVLFPIPLPVRQPEDNLEKEKKKKEEEEEEKEEKKKEKKKRKEEETEERPIKKRKIIIKFIFRTQMDKRVCPLCKEHENEEFLPTEEIPMIPVHPNCRCTYDVIYDTIYESSFHELRKIYQAVKAIKIINTIPYIKAISS